MVEADGDDDEAGVGAMMRMVGQPGGVLW